jgi:hypothetical protein
MTTFPPIDLPPPRKGTGPLAAIAADANEFRKALKMLDDRTRALFPHPSPSIRPSVTPAGTTYTAAGGARPAREQLLPFEAYARSVESEETPGTFELQLVAAPGTIAAFSKPETVETAPADGTWYFYVSATVNATTGAITETNAEWSNSEIANTATVYYALLAEIVIADGEIDGPIVQYTYGPMAAVVHGGVSNTWEVYLV